MLLTPQDVELFFKLNRALMSFVNQRLEVIPEDNGSTEKLAALSPDTPLKLRDAFLKHTDLIQSFVEENPVHLADDELAIVRSWQYLVPGKFYIFRELTKYTVFLSTDKQPIAYGVLALSQPFEELVPSPLPILTETVLLPFKGRIVYDGMLNTYRISFGPGIRRSLNETFKEAKERYGIVTSLPMSDNPLPAKTPRAKPRPKVQSKEATAEVLQVILQMIDQFCRAHLNDEYAVLCRKLAEKLAQTSLAAFERPPEHLGQRHRAHHRWGQLSPRQEPDSPHAPERHRRLFRYQREYRGSQGGGHPKDAEDLSAGSELDLAEPSGRQPDGVDAGSRWLRDRRSSCFPGSTGDRLQQRFDPLYPRRSTTDSKVSRGMSTEHPLNHFDSFGNNGLQVRTADKTLRVNLVEVLGP